MSTSAGFLSFVVAPLMLLFGVATIGGVLTLVGGTLGFLATTFVVLGVVLYVVASVARSARYDAGARF